VAEQLSDDRQPQGGACADAREGMAQIIKAHAFELCESANRPPGTIQIRARLVRTTTRDHKRTTLDARKLAQQTQGWPAEDDGLASRLAVREKEGAAFEIDMPPLEIENLARTHAGQYQKADRCHGKRIENAAPVFRLRSMLRLRLRGKSDIAKLELVGRAPSAWNEVILWRLLDNREGSAREKEAADQLGEAKRR